MYLKHKKHLVNSNMHCLGQFTAYVLSPLADLWLCNVSYLPRLQLGALNIPLWMKWAISVSSFW